VTLLGEFGVSAGTARVALARLARRDLLSRVKDGRLVHYRSTVRLQHVLDEGDRRIFSLGREEHRAELWTVLWHWLPEELRLQRGRLARRLRFLGFGSVQDGTWVSPHQREEEVIELLEDLGITDYATVLIGKSARSLDLNRLAESAWDLGGLAERYRGFVDEFSPLRSDLARRTLDDREAFLLRTRLVHTFRGFPFLDPELPDELMPDPRGRTEAVTTFHELYAALAGPAQRHFDALTEGHPALLAP
jgi:phenylacetic acid degradation operon negative regulatory protein